MIGLLMRDGFLFALKHGEGEVMMSDVLKRKEPKVAAMQVVKK